MAAPRVGGTSIRIGSERFGEIITISDSSDDSDDFFDLNPPPPPPQQEPEPEPEQIPEPEPRPLPPLRRGRRKIQAKNIIPQEMIPAVLIPPVVLPPVPHRIPQIPQRNPQQQIPPPAFALNPVFANPAMLQMMLLAMKGLQNIPGPPPQKPIPPPPPLPPPPVPPKKQLPVFQNILSSVRENKKKKEITFQKNRVDITFKSITNDILDALAEAIRIGQAMKPKKLSTTFDVIARSKGAKTNLVERFVLGAKEQTIPDSHVYEEQLVALFMNLYPHLGKAVISKTVMNGLDMKTFFRSLDESKSKPLKQSRAITNTFNVKDLLISALLCLFLRQERLDWEKGEELKQKAEEKARIEAEEEALYKKAEAEGSLMECECCFATVPFERLVQCPEGHLFCSNCVKQQIHTTIGEGRSKVPCLHFGGCDQQISVNELKRTIPEDLLTQLFQIEVINAVMESDIGHLVKCAKCDFRAEYDGEKPMNCPLCKTATCPKCQLEAHPNKTCEEAKAAGSVEEKMNEAVIRECPKCKTRFIKDEGCNKMECPCCHTLICYWCRQVISKEVGYNHFWRGEGVCPPNQCPLWVQNQDFQQVQALQAKDQA